MSILIKGMEMPTSCESCPCKTADAFGGLGCQATGYIPLRKANQDRPDNCPLDPVPPHGRLGDLDALKKILVTAIPQYSLAGCTTYADSDIMRWIDEAPTVIPADPEEEKMK